MGDKSSEQFLDGAAAICSPHRVMYASHDLTISLFGAVEKYMAKKLRISLHDNLDILKGLVKSKLEIDLE